MATYTPKRKTLFGTESVQFPISAVNGLADVLDGKVSMITVPTEGSTTVINMINAVRDSGADISDWNIIKLRGYITETYGLQISHYGGGVYHIEGVDLNDMGVMSNTTDWTGITLGAFQTMFSAVQKATDYGLQTTDQTIVGAINEVNSGKADATHYHNGEYLGWNRSSYNINTLYDAQISMIAQGSNLPCGSPYGVNLTLPYRKLTGNTIPDFGAQIFIPNGDDPTKPNSMFFRTALGSTWNPWKEVATTDMLATSSEGMPQIRFAGLSGYGIVHSEGGNFTINGTQYKGNKLGLHFTVEIVGGGPLKVGDAIQMCSMKTHSGCRGNGYRRRQKLRRFKEYKITAEDLDKRFITIHIENGGVDDALRELFHNGRADTNKYSPIYFRVRRPKGKIQDNNSGMTVDAEFSNVVTVWKSYGLEFEDDAGQSYDKFNIL